LAAVDWNCHFLGDPNLHQLRSRDEVSASAGSAIWVSGPDFLPQALAVTFVLPALWVMLDQSRRRRSIECQLMLSVR
jgi:hypothetical protein